MDAPTVSDMTIVVLSDTGELLQEVKVADYRAPNGRIYGVGAQMLAHDLIRAIERASLVV